MNKKTFKTLATGAAITLATVGASTVSADTQYGIVLNRVTGEWQTVNHVTGEIVKSEPNGTYSTYDEANAGLSSWLETQASTVETPTAETTAVEAPKTSADVKPALDAQQAVVDATAAEANQAQADADAANQTVTTAQADFDTATQAVKDAEANAANATPENIAANQADQAANLADQEANATETDQVNAEIADQTNKVADAQTAVDTAQAEKDQADATVVSKQADVKAAQDAISGTGLAEAQATLDQTTKDVTTAQSNVNTATTAVDVAKKADVDRQTAIDAATTDVAVKTDAVTTASAKLTAAQDAVKQTTDALTKATDAVKSATDALKNNKVTVNTSAIDYFGEKTDELSKAFQNFSKQIHNKNYDKAYQELGYQTTQNKNTKDKEIYNLLTSENAKNIANQLVGSDILNKPLDNNNGRISLTKEEYVALNKVMLSRLNALRQLNGTDNLSYFDDESINLGLKALAFHQTIADKFPTTNVRDFAHGLETGIESPGLGLENLAFGFGPLYMSDQWTLSKFADNLTRSMMMWTFVDEHAEFGHYSNLLYGKGPTLFGVFSNDISSGYSYNAFNLYKPAVIDKIQANLSKAKADQAAAQTASNNAKAELTKASADYAKALELKTQAEKTLADATATPLQTQVAENNLRLAKIALQNAETRKADAQKAIDNFSANLADKKAALDTAKAELATAQAIATAKAEVLETAKAELVKQQGTLDSLNKERDALLAEKDRLVEEAKALAEELDGYLNAPAILEKAKATLAEKQATLTEAQAKAAIAQEKLETVTAKLAEEQAKLAELQAEYDKLKDLEDKAKDNVIATLPDGTIIAVPKVAPTVAEKPAIDIDAVKQALDKGQDVKVVDGKVVVTNPQAGVTVTPQGITYSRVERAKTLPNTGEQTSLLALAGVAVLSSLGLAVTKRKRRG
ncbi:TPA: SEC10/PgrA surface exclusion domain-containing protein [Streptococcus suis]|nr:SEC10/PgrA surface exclusion domain-containing protein [Streptococcus suis]